jgi:Putative zinc-finger
MVIGCEDVWREISNYLEGDLDPAVKRAMEEHFAQCRHCEAVLDGVRNVIALYGDEKMFTLPADFYPRLRRRLAVHVEGRRGTARPWFFSLAATGALAASVLLAGLHQSTIPEQRSVMSQPARRMPQGLVAVVDEGKKFHAPGCPFIHGKYRMITPEEAVREGYTPCTRCMYEALRIAGKMTPEFAGEEVAINAAAAE